MGTMPQHTIADGDRSLFNDIGDLDQILDTVDFSQCLPDLQMDESSFIGQGQQQRPWAQNEGLNPLLFNNSDNLMADDSKIGLECRTVQDFLNDDFNANQGLSDATNILEYHQASGRNFQVSPLGGSALSNFGVQGPRFDFLAQPPTYASQNVTYPGQHQVRDRTKEGINASAQNTCSSNDTLTQMTTKLRNAVDASARTTFRGRSKRSISPGLTHALAKSLRLNVNSDSSDLVHKAIREIEDLRKENAQLKEKVSLMQSSTQGCGDEAKKKVFNEFLKKRKGGLNLREDVPEGPCRVIGSALSNSVSDAPSKASKKLRLDEFKCVPSDLEPVSISMLSKVLQSGSLPSPEMLSAVLQNQIAMSSNQSRDPEDWGDHSRCA